MIPDPGAWEARFMNELLIQRYTMDEYIRMRFNEFELKELIYMMNELKAAREVLNNAKDK